MMFAFFQKKLTPKEIGEIHHLFWGDPEEWLAFGGDDGTSTLLNTKTVLTEVSCRKFVHNGRREERESPDFETLTYPGKATGTVQVVCWNSAENRLRTVDEAGYFGIWKRDNEVWVNESFCFNAWKGLKDWAVSPDGKKICVLCSDGRLYLCNMGGQKLWSKDLKRRMRHVLWSPTGLELLLCSEAGELFFYDSEGFYTHSFHSERGNEATCAALVPVVDIDWYPGDRRVNLDPALAIAYENGCVEVFIGDVENEPLKFDAHFVHCTAASWRPTGEVLAVLGSSRVLHPLVPAGRKVDEKSDFVIRFYSTTGSLLHTLALPEGRRAQAFCWNRRGDKIVVASGCTLFFAKVRPTYAAAYFASTLVYTTPASEGTKQLLWFWNTDNQSKHLRIVDKVLHIQAAAEGCLVVTEGHSCRKRQHLAGTTVRYALTVYSRCGDVRKVFGSGSTPKHTAFTETHIISADSHTLSIWVYNVLPVENWTCEKNRSYLANVHRRNISGTQWSSGKGVDQRMRTTAATLSKASSIVRTTEKNYPIKLILAEAQESNHIVALTANACCFIVARKCGELRRYSLPTVEFHYKYNLCSPPLEVQINSDGSRLAVVDVLHVLRLYDAVQRRCSGTSGLENCTLDALYERENVDHVLWARDHPGSLAIVQKNTFYIAHGTAMEEIVKCSAYLLEYRDLRVSGVYFDQLMKLPFSPNTNHLYEFCTKPLRDTNAMLRNPLNLPDGLSYINQRSHPNLWRLLATAALKASNFTIAEEAYVKCQDYFGLLFLKHLSALDGTARQQAELYANSANVNAAERLYVSGQRMNLAGAPMSSREESRDCAMSRAHSCEPKAIQDELGELADSYIERCCWLEAIDVYRQLQNKPLLAHALYVTEQYEEMYNLVADIAEGDDLLSHIGRRLASVGMYDEAVNTFRKAGNLKIAEEVCVNSRFWDTARRVPGASCSHTGSEMAPQFTKHLLHHSRIDHAIELSQRESSTPKAVTVLLQGALGANTDALQSDPVKAKMIYVLAGLLVERDPEKVTKPQGSCSECSFKACLTGRKSVFLNGRLKLTGLRPSAHALDITRAIPNKAQLGSLRMDDEVAACWRGAEAYHLFLLYHEHMARKRFNDAVCTATRLLEYSEYVMLHVAYAMLALAGCYAQNWRVCSTALMRIEYVQTVPVQHKEKIAKLAVDIFSRHCPVSPVPDNPAAPLCPQCHAGLHSWDIMCQECGASFPFCVGSGRPIFAHHVTDSLHASLEAADESNTVRLRLPDQGEDVLTCTTCRRKMFATVARAFGCCPLCHTLFAASSASAPEYRILVEHQTSRKNMSCVPEVERAVLPC